MNSNYESFHDILITFLHMKLLLCTNILLIGGDHVRYFENKVLN